MYIGQLPSQIKTKERMWQINFICLVSVFVMSLWGVFSEEERAVCESERSLKILKQPYEEIGWGVLALNEMREMGPLPFLTKELIVLGKNNRPERLAKEGFFLLGLKSSQEEIIVAEKQPVFLTQDEEGQWHFCLSKTSLGLSCSMGEGDKVLVHVDSGKGEGAFNLKCFDKAGGVIEKMPYVKALEGAKVWGYDLLIQNYGGEEYRGLLRKNKIEVNGKVYFLAEGDLLMWKGEEWQQVLLKNIEPLTPIAKVVTSSPEGMRLQVWDESGFHTTVSKKTIERSPKLAHKAEELFSCMRMRSSSEVTCLLGKRRVILREGDWWLKMESGWKKLKTAGDIEDYLDHKLRGELFIFESIVADKGKVVVKGSSFDVMRTEMQQLALTTSLAKKQLVPSQKEAPVIAKADGARFQRAEKNPREAP